MYGPSPFGEPLRAAVLLVGDELLAGHTRDANAHYIAQRLSALGHRLRRISVISDEVHAIHRELDLCGEAAEIVFVSGGLGPTHDDRTTEAVALRFGRRTVVDEPSWRTLVERYGQRRGITEAIREAAKKMVTVPEGVEILENPAGAACGYVLREGGVAYVILPGVPAELQAIFETHIVGKVLGQGEQLALVEVDIEMMEAAFSANLGMVADKYADVEIGSYPHFGERRVTLRFKGDDGRAREAMEAFFASTPEARERIVQHRSAQR